jgi:hypothetical protein
MFYENNDTLRGYLKRGAAESYYKLIEHRSFLFADAVFAKALAEVREQFAHLSEEEARARAAFRLLTSGAPPSVAQPVVAWPVRAREWARAKAVWGWPYVKIAWAVAVLALLLVLCAHAEPAPQNMQAYRNALRGFSLLAPIPSGLASPQQPNGLILQFQQSGSTVAIRPQGLVTFNCTTNMTCSWSGNTFTLTSSGGGSGSGCVPSGSPASAVLYDTGSGTCNDISKLTWNSGTSTLSGVSGGTYDFTPGTRKVPGTSGQLLFNNGGNEAAEDPIVSFNYVNLLNAVAATAQATGSATRVSTFGAYGTLYFTFASVTGSPSGCTVQIKNYDSLGNALNNGSAISVTPSNGTTTATLTPAANLFTAAQVSATYSCATTYPTGGTITVDYVPAVVTYVGNTVNAAQSGTWTVQPGNTANTTAWLVTGTGGTFPVTGTFWQATQPVSGSGVFEVGPTTSANTLSNQFFTQLTDGTHGNTFMSTTTASKWGADVNLLSILGTAPTTAGFLDIKGADGNVFVRQATAANLNATVVGTGTFAVQAAQSGNWTTRVVGNTGASFDGATNAAPPANAILQGVVAATALPSATTATDTVAPMADKFGRAVHVPITVRDLVKMASVQTTNSTQTNLLAGQGSGVFADLISLFITSESSTACTISLTDGTTTYKINVANSQGSGSVWAPPTPVPAASTNTAWQVTGCTSVTLDYNAQFALNK